MRAAAVAVTPLASRTRHAGDGTRVHPELDAVWFAHGRELTEASRLLRRIEQLSSRELTKLCHTMERIGRTAGLDGPWRVVEHGPISRLAYCGRYDERMQAAENEFRWHILQDEFDGQPIRRPSRTALPRARHQAPS